MRTASEIAHARARLLESRPDYASAKEHARELDRLFGFSCEDIEAGLLSSSNPVFEDRETWRGLELQSLQTPYAELVAMIERLEPAPGETWVDLGAGYGRLGLALALLRPEVHFLGVELVEARVREGARVLTDWGASRAQLVVGDVAADAEPLPKGDLYFLYDFGSKGDVDRVLSKLAGRARERAIRVVGRGRGVRHWIAHEHPWLGSVHEPEHHGNWSLYRS